MKKKNRNKGGAECDRLTLKIEFVGRLHEALRGKDGIR